MLAVVLAVPLREVDHSVPPDRTVAGLPLALRAVLTVQQQGADRVVLVVPEGDTLLAETIAGDHRVAEGRVQIAEVAPGRGLWSELSEVVDEPFVLARYDVVAQPSVYAALAEQPSDDVIGVLASRGGVPLGPLWGKPELLAAAGETEGLAALMDRADVASWDVGERWVVEAGSAPGRRQILRGLLGDCRKPVDGLISRHLNRHVSLFVSRLLVNTPVTPNVMTGLTFGVGLVGVWFVVQGGYQATLIGALLMQLNSILDGCDGELARLRFQGSKLGQWLDTLGDDVSNILYWAALGFGALELGGPWAFWFAVCGWVAAGANLLAAIQWYGLLRGLGSGDLNAIQADDEPPEPGFVGGVVRFASLVLKQDFFIFFLACLAVAGVIYQTLPLFALGAVVTLAAATVRTARAWGRRRASGQPNSK
ncbi:MAG: CDP-alcohol phosphatidyltransferase family protein [Deltaproteobacteria bacterium]|nr:CDP-alcohol phosphatidyltransferase family protein [Deltaproteobacteria bacterium]